MGVNAGSGGHESPGPTLHQWRDSDRVGDADRSRAIAVLGRALGAGYLDALEYSDRLELALVSHTREDLGELTADLPLAAHKDSGRVRRAALIGLRIHTAAAVVAVGICWVIWLAVGWGVGAWYPWPVWPTLGAGLGVLGHAVPVWAVVGRD